MLPNYSKLQDEQLAAISAAESDAGKKPKLLLHACCAPCSSYVLELLTSYFDISIYYYNPNIYPEAEYLRRLTELENFLNTNERSFLFKANSPAADADELAVNRKTPLFASQPVLVHTDYNPEEYYTATNVRSETELQTEPERGERCRRCYYFRMKKAYEYAISNGFDYFTTTLSISPYKDAEKINTIGRQLKDELPSDVEYLYADFKKKNGFLRSLELSKEFGLYRQDYCGCIYSMQNGNSSRKSN